MAKARVTTAHTYNEGDALAIVESIYSEFAGLLNDLNTRLAKEKQDARNLQDLFS